MRRRRAGAVKAQSTERRITAPLAHRGSRVEVSNAPAVMVEGGASMFELKVFVHEGRHFPSDTSFEVNGVFDNEQTGTGFTRLSTTPVWSGPPLTWRRDAESVRKLQSQGAQLKLTGAPATHLNVDATHPAPVRAKSNDSDPGPPPVPPTQSKTITAVSVG